MVVTNTNVISGPYTGNGVLTTFDRTFFASAESHVKVYETISGVETELVSGFTHTGIGTNAGTVEFAVPPVIGSSIRLARILPLTQQSDYNTQGSVDTEVIENDLDLLTMMMQQVAAGLGSTVPGGGEPATSADAVSFSSIVGNEAADVQTAIANNTAAIPTFTAAGETWVGLADAAAQRAALGVPDVIDEDDFATDSATRPPSQQSVKAYVNGNSVTHNFVPGAAEYELGDPGSFKNIQIIFEEIQAGSSGTPLGIQLSTGGAYVTSGYTNRWSAMTGNTASSGTISTGHLLQTGSTADCFGRCQITKIGTTNAWYLESTIVRGTSIWTSASQITLAGACDGIRLTGLDIDFFVSAVSLYYNENY